MAVVALSQLQMRWLWLLLSVSCVAVCVAPKHLAYTVGASASTAATGGIPGAAVGTAVAGAAAAAWLLLGRNKRPTQAHLDVAAQPVALRKRKEASVVAMGKGKAPVQVRQAPDSRDAATSRVLHEDVMDEDADGLLSESNDNGSGSEAEESADEADEVEAGASSAGTSSNSGKLWSAKQFPEGMSAAHNWDQDNLIAAQKWECPCTDRSSCISADRIQLTELGWYRKGFRLKHKGVSGGLRDACRREMMEHYDKVTSSFTRSFVVGPLGDCCVAAAGLAKGLCFGTFASARADVSKDRAWHKDRVAHRGKKLSVERAHLMAYIRQLKKGYEGPKGGSDPKAKWKTAYVPIPKRWATYERSRRARSLPIVGTQALFAKLWKEQTDIIEEESCGHGKCNICGDLDAQQDTYTGRADDEAKKQLKRIAAERELHDKEHLGERACAQPPRCEHAPRTLHLTVVRAIVCRRFRGLVVEGRGLSGAGHGVFDGCANREAI